MRKTVTWILVADGARARLLRNDGPGRGITVAGDREFIGTRLKSRELGTDRPGRAFDRAGEGRHAMEPPTDPHRHAEQEFARSMARMLEDGANRESYDRLVLVAPPRALGDLRGALSGTVRDRVIAELNRDLTTAGLDEVAAALGDVLAV